jgi:hypothetical protein
MISGTPLQSRNAEYFTTEVGVLLLTGNGNLGKITFSAVSDKQTLHENLPCSLKDCEIQTKTQTK